MKRFDLELVMFVLRITIELFNITKSELAKDVTLDTTRM